MTKDIYRTGKFDARYSAFIETILCLHPQLHRYCSRMTGSVLDGEDIVQDVLFDAYRKAGLSTRWTEHSAVALSHRTQPLH
jgi:RNA polymerase sigma-70 factor (ECF subfamily)